MDHSLFLKQKDLLKTQIDYLVRQVTIFDKLESLEIDDPLDWVLAESALKNNEDLFIY